MPVLKLHGFVLMNTIELLLTKTSATISDDSFGIFTTHVLQAVRMHVLQESQQISK